jgi:hypothetical protein
MIWNYIFCMIVADAGYVGKNWQQCDIVLVEIPILFKESLESTDSNLEDITILYIFFLSSKAKRNKK